MNVKIMAVSMALVILVLLVLVYRAKRLAPPVRERFNQSRRKQVLIKNTRLKFLVRNWRIKQGTIVGNQEVTWFVTSKLGTFDLICLDPNRQEFISETKILDQLEDVTRYFRSRNNSPIIVTDDGFSNQFLERANGRGILAINANELDLLVGLADYAEDPKRPLSAQELQILETSYTACTTLSYQFKEIGDMQQAVGWARRAIKSRYGYSAHYLLFSLLLDINDLDGAEQIGLEGLSYQKDSVHFFQGFQRIAKLRGDDRTALSWAERWVTAEPANPWAYDNLASLHQKQQNGWSAAGAIDQALNLAPMKPNLLCRAAKIALLNSDIIKAKQHADRWVAAAPNDSSAYELLAEVFLRQQKYTDAAEAIGKAVGLDPHSPNLNRRASLIALEAGDLAEAKRWAERWLAIAPEDPWAYDHMSNVYLRYLDYESAKGANAKSLEIDPENPNFLRRLTLIQAGLVRPVVPKPSVSY